MQKTKTFLTLIALTAFALSPILVAHADQSAPATQTPDTSISAQITIPTDQTDITSDPTITADDQTVSMPDELATLEAKMQDPNLGFFTKFWIHLKINEIKNQIAVQNAVQ